ncbi:hypothetical protein LJR231_005524 [Phyllobacterium sp. LjRoot231]|uniref:hypothetical protein n=1 Tax=Phyllobacterium sp. LjRoot231 TaxID=3342289 RepID=UPI003ED136B3
MAAFISGSLGQSLVMPPSHIIPSPIPIFGLGRPHFDGSNSFSCLLGLVVGTLALLFRRSESGLVSRSSSLLA